MKIRESGMPDETAWELFFKPDALLKEMEISRDIQDIAEFGCGYGTFTIPASRIVRGKVYAIDIEPGMIERVLKRSGGCSANNIETVLRDFISEGSGLPDESVDYVMLFNILHAEDPENLLKETYRILRSGGKAGIIHWNYDPLTPRGPPMEIRPRPERCMQWAQSMGLEHLKSCDLRPYHYGLVFRKPA
ncbi:MAG TPA: class I SAM-dependent methyltransferase [Methanotrichaceae archaeon]|nr:class I SAM-dependent methyltransferase [Methanotrichaceae archaeon]